MLDDDNYYHSCCCTGFFVTVCVATFMVWKREAEIRTDSIRAIESNLERLGDRLAAESQPEEREPGKTPCRRNLQILCGRNLLFQSMSR